MEAYKAKAIIWNIPWESHEIRFEFLKGTMWDYYIGPRFLVFFDGKRIKTFNHYTTHVSGMVENENGNSYLIECGVYSKSDHRIQWPLRKSFWGRISGWIDSSLTSQELNAWFIVNEKLIYLTHIGGADSIEWVDIQQKLNELTEDERALVKGKIECHGSNEKRRWEKAQKNRLEQTKIYLTNRRKELEARLSAWKAKNK